MKIIIAVLLLLSVLSVTATAQINIGSKHDKVYDFCFSKDGNHLIVPINNNIMMFETKEHRLIKEITFNQQASCLAIDINNSGDNIVIGTNDSSLVIWDLCRDNNIQTIHQLFLITSVRFSPNDSLLAIGLRPNYLMIRTSFIHRLNLEYFSD